MISPRPGVAFSLADAGDLRHDHAARRAWSRRWGLPEDWATVRQVHGARVVEATGPGDWGEADALFTRARLLPVTVFTADCLGVILVGPGAVGVAHAGWRGIAAGVVANLASTMTEEGHPPLYAALGPGIGPCCFEVGEEVAVRFPEHRSTTRTGATSVDLWEAVCVQLPAVEIWRSNHCTFHLDGTFSHRRHHTEERMAALTWMP